MLVELLSDDVHGRLVHYVIGRFPVKDFDNARTRKPESYPCPLKLGNPIFTKTKESGDVIFFTIIPINFSFFLLARPAFVNLD